MNLLQSIQRRGLPRWPGIGRWLLGVVLGTSGAMLTTTGRVLIICGLLAQTLRARLGPQ